MALDHYVSRWILRRWTREESDDAELFVADLTAFTIERSTPRRAFAGSELHEAAVERRLNEVFESPLSRFARQFLDKKPTGQASIRRIDDRQIWRAMAVGVWLQAMRANEALATSRISLPLGDAILDDRTVDFLAQQFRAEHDIACVWLPWQRRFFLPETGIFAYPLGPRSEHEPLVDFGIAMPMAPGLALVASPHGTRRPTEAWEGEMEWVQAQEFSVGATASRVVVPWELIDEYGEEECIRSLKILRANAVAGITAIERTNAYIGRRRSTG